MIKNLKHAKNLLLANLIHPLYTTVHMYSYSKSTLVLTKPLVLPLAQSKVRAGFPSPADDFLEKEIDLATELVKHPLTTFMLRVAGDSMQGAGIDEGDILVVDRSLTPRHGQIVIAIVDNEFTVKYLHRSKGTVKLVAANPTYPDITFSDAQTLEVWGVVTSCVKQFVV